MAMPRGLMGASGFGGLLGPPKYDHGDKLMTPEGEAVVRDITPHPHYQYIYDLSVKGSPRMVRVDEPQLERWQVELKKKAKPKEVKLDLKALDKLIIAKEVKDEINAVLQQHTNQKKIFEDWGLGETIEYGKGMTFLFYGPPGTGKTWGAHCIAKAIGTDLLVIGSGEIQSSEPGAANRNIQEAFKSATETGKVLFLDECDSLISSRDGVGMVLGSEINTLLTEIEKFEGVLVLATNRVEHLDEALERRIGLIVEFPEPEYEQRIEIWNTLLPQKMPLGNDVKVEELARYNLTGGLIKNCILQAARFAAAAKVGMLDTQKVKLDHFKAAIDRVLKSKSLLGTASRWHTAKVREDMSIGKTRHTDKIRGSGVR